MVWVFHHYAKSLEIGHLLLHYNKRDVIVSYENEEDDKEKEANEFAQDFFIDPVDYVVARLQHDGRMGYEQFLYLH